MARDLIQDVFVKTVKNKFTAQIKLSDDFDFTGYALRQVLFPDLNAPIVGDAGNPCAELLSGIKGNTILTTANATGIQWWSPACPAMYSLTTELISPQGEVEFSRVDRISFRDIKFDGKMFFLNGLPLTKEQIKDIKTMPFSADQSLVEQCNETGSLIVIEVEGNAGQKPLLTAVERLRNSPSVIAWYATQKNEFNALSAFFEEIDGTRPVIKAFPSR